jgi:hypothetical protein
VPPGSFDAEQRKLRTPTSVFENEHMHCPHDVTVDVHVHKATNPPDTMHG